MKSKYSEYLNTLKYNPSTGTTTLPDGSLLNLTEDLFCYLYPPNPNYKLNTSCNKNKIKLKYSTLVHYLVHGVLPGKKQKVHHKDLNPRNFCLNNIVLISNSTYFKIKEYLYNLQGGLKLYNHPKDRLKVLLEYKVKGRVAKTPYEDSESAKKAMLRLQHKMLKYLGEYVVTD